MDRSTIRALIMDVDGTLTDGGIYMGHDGEVLKKFHVKDGLGIHIILPEHNVIPIILTGRSSSIVRNRAKEMGVEYVLQGSTDKLTDMKQLLESLQIELEQTAYIGDDINDLQAMEAVGLRGCPKDAAREIREISDFISEYLGGNGAVRDFIEWIVQT
ncbi:MAG: KdsC family phosphatase [Lachnospiraceae bacterium]